MEKYNRLRKKKQRLAIPLSLPEDDSNIRHKVFNEINISDLSKEDGVDTLIKFLEKMYKEDELFAAYETWAEFDHYRQTEKIPMEEYVTEFRKYI